MTTTSTATATVPATDKQMQFLNSLLSQRGQGAYAGAPLGKRDASAMIDAVRSTPRPTTPAAPTARPTTGADAPTKVGVYANGSKVYRVYAARNGGHLLATLLLSDGTFDYQGGAARFVKASQRLTLEQAAAYGAQFGVCCVCGRLLTDPESVAAGIGPICGDRY